MLFVVAVLTVSGCKPVPPAPPQAPPEAKPQEEATAETTPDSEPELEEEKLTPKEEALSGLFDSELEDEKELELRIAKAREVGVSEFSRMFSRMYFASLQERPEVVGDAESYGQKLLAQWEKDQDTEVIATRKALLSHIEYHKAVVARLRRDEAAFKKHVFEAIWQDPEMAYSALDLVSQFQEEAWRRSVQVPMDLPLARIKGEPVTLGSLFGPQTKVLYVDFWASWCAPCLASMPELKRRALALGPQGVAFATINMAISEIDPESPAKIDEVIEKTDLDIPWLRDDDNERFTKLLHVDSIPHVVLLDREGRLLFSGSPHDVDEIDTALKPLGLKLPPEPEETEEAQ